MEGRDKGNKQQTKYKEDKRNLSMDRSSELASQKISLFLQLIGHVIREYLLNGPGICIIFIHQIYLKGYFLLAYSKYLNLFLLNYNQFPHL